MAVETMPGEQAWATYRSNELARWPTREDPARLWPLASPQARGLAPLRGDERVFCIGSCFAREVENALEALGFPVLSIMRDFPASPNRQRSDRGMLNKYNVASILNELRWALGEGEPYRHEQVLIGAPGDLLLRDLHLTGDSYADEPGRAREFREAFNRFFQRIREAEVVVLTLGLSEVWYDRHTGLHLNHAPSEHLVACYPGRFELQVFDHAETLAYLQEIDRLLQAHLVPGWRLLLTVSPVPLWSTFRQQDVLVANSYSKAVLRAAVDAFLAARPVPGAAGYFPSCEFALLSRGDAVWRDDDFRHVDPVFVDFIIQSVLLQLGVAPAAMQARLAATRRALLQRLDGPGAGAGPGALARWWAALPARWRRWRQQRRAPKLAAAQGHLDRWDGQVLAGWAFVPGRPEPAQVDVLLDGVPLLSATAELPRPDVAQAHGGHRLRCGFHIEVPGPLAAGSVLSVRVAGQTLKTLPVRPDTPQPSRITLATEGTPAASSTNSM